MAKKITQQDLRQAKLNPRAKTEFYRKGSPASMLPNDVLIRLRKLARETLFLMQASGKKMTQQEWYTRLVNVLKSRNPQVREKIMAQLEARDKEK
jgi:hypothetical protein